MNAPLRLDGKVTLITGASSGIGAAAAELFADEGATVIAAARRDDATAAVADRIAARGGNVSALVCDVTDPALVNQVIAEIGRRHGRLDILVNNAGVIFRDKTAVETDPAEWELTMAVNATGTFLMSRAAVPLMAATGGGAIVNNASYFGLVGGRGAAAYCAAKGAVVLLTKAMALDHAAQGIRVNCVCPGSVETPMLQQEMEEMGGAERVRHLFEEKHPLGRISQPEEIARAMLFLASDEASFITGVALPVDGGLTAG